MGPEERRTWFHGYSAWYVRAIIWFLQASIAGVILNVALGTVGAIISGLVASLLLFRQIDNHVTQELSTENR